MDGVYHSRKFKCTKNAVIKRIKKRANARIIQPTYTHTNKRNAKKTETD